MHLKLQLSWMTRVYHWTTLLYFLVSFSHTRCSVLRWESTWGLEWWKCLLYLFFVSLLPFLLLCFDSCMIRLSTMPLRSRYSGTSRLEKDNKEQETHVLRRHISTAKNHNGAWIDLVWCFCFVVEGRVGKLFDSSIVKNFWHSWWMM